MREPEGEKGGSGGVFGVVPGGASAVVLVLVLVTMASGASVVVLVTMARGVSAVVPLPTSASAVIPPTLLPVNPSGASSSPPSTFDEADDSTPTPEP